MKKRFSVEQIVAVLQQVEGGIAVKDVCRQVGVSEQTYYRWKKVYGGIPPSEALVKNLVSPSGGARRGSFGFESGLEHCVELMEHGGDVCGDPSPSTGFE